MKKLLFLCIIITLCVLFLQTASHAFSINISPPSLKLSVQPGQSASGTITVLNRGEETVGILVYTEDWLYAPDGSKSFHAAGTTPLSCAKWLRIFPKKFQLEGGEKMGVQYTVNMPEDAKGGYYAVVFFESVPSAEEERDEGMMVRFAGRLGTIIYLETEGKSTRSATVESFSVTVPQSDKPLEMSLSYKNTGDVYIGAEGTLNIIDDEGNIFGKETFGPVNTLPGDTRGTKAEWLGELEEGTYYTVVTLDIGGDEPIVREAEFTVSSGGTIESLSVDSSKELPSFSVLVKNTGQLNIDVGGRIDVLKKDGELVKSLNLKKSLIAPGKERQLEAALDEKLPQGAYTAKAVISIGAKEFTKEETFSIE